MSLPTCLLFYDVDGNVVGTLDYMVQYDDDGRPVGLVDFDLQELSGGRLREIAEHSAAVGAGTWPEWIGARAMDFKVDVRSGEKGGTHKITGLVHRISGHKRERQAIDAAVAFALEGKGPGDIVDLRPILGGPEKSLDVDADGVTVLPRAKVRPVLPLRPVKPETIVESGDKG